MQSRNPFSLSLSVLASIGLLVGVLHRSACAEPLVKTGDRVVFFGDSITSMRVYTRYVMNFITLRYPELKVTFRNAGKSGDTAGDGLKRFDRDVLSAKPTIVTICFGMNDGNEMPFHQGMYNSYVKNTTELVDRLQQAKVLPVLLTPGCVDTDRKPRDKGYNDTLARYAEAVLALAREKQVASYDLHTLMVDVQTRAKADDPAFTMIGDGVHPAPPGHAVMAFALLKALKCTDRASSLTIDVADRITVADRCSVSDLQTTADTVAFTRVDNALPAYLDPDARVIFGRYLKFDEEINQYGVCVKSLPPGSYSLTAEGVEVGTFSSADLAAGVNLASKPGPWMVLGKKVNDLVREQEELQSKYMSTILWKPKDTPEATQAAGAKLLEQIEQKEAARLKVMTEPRAWKWQFKRVDDAPAEQPALQPVK